MKRSEALMFIALVLQAPAACSDAHSIRRLSAGKMEVANSEDGFLGMYLQ